MSLTAELPSLLDDAEREKEIPLMEAKARRILQMLQEGRPTADAQKLRLRAMAVLARSFNGHRQYEDGIATARAALGEAAGADDPWSLSMRANLTESLGLMHFHLEKRVEALAYLQEALELARQAGDRRREGTLLCDLGIYHERMTDGHTAQPFFEKAVVMHEEHGLPEDLARTYHFFSYNRRTLGDGPGFLDCLQKANSYAVQAGDAPRARVVVHDIGVWHREHGSTEDSLQYFKQALAAEEAVGNDIGIGMVSHNLGVASIDLNQPEGAVPFLETAIRMFQRTRNQRAETSARAMIGKALHMCRRFDEAEVQLLQGLEMCRRIDFRGNEALTLREMGLLELAKGNVAAALPLLRNAVDIKMELKQHVAGFVHHVGQALAVADSPVYDPKEAEARLLEALAASESEGAPTIRTQILFDLARLHQQTGHWQRAYEYLERAHDAEKAQRQASAEKSLQGLTLRFSERERALLAEKNQEILKRQRLVEQHTAEISAHNSDLQRKNAELRDLHQFKELMMGMIVHDLKNPLAAIINLTDFDPEPQIMAAIRQSGYSMLNLVSNLLDVQKFEASAIVLQREACGASELFREALTQVRFFIAEKRLNVHEEDSTVAPLDCDPAIMGRVIVNLLTNAVKYTAHGGSITLGAATGANGSVRIWIRDTGIGIAPDRIDGLFERYRQPNAARRLGAVQSTGLGLAFCKLAVEAHGGTLTVQSTPGSGTTFMMTL